MAFGLAIRTTAGLVDIGAQAVRSARLIATRNLSGNAGSVGVGDYNAAQGFFHARLTNNSILPPLEWNNTSRVLSWSTAGFIEHQNAPVFTVCFYRNV